MRKLIAVALAALTLSLGAPAGLFAQTPANLQRGTISGEAVDAGGRAIAAQRVELVQLSQVLQTTTTDGRGSFTFTSVPAGDYIVRVVVNGQNAGLRVSVAQGAVATAMIVAPSAAVPSGALLGPLGPVWGALVGVGLAAGIITTVVVVSGS